jgi:hypothetical protein
VVKLDWGWDHRRSPVVDRVDDLARIDSLEINRRDPEVRMPELALDDRQRDPFVSHLDRVRVPELVIVPTSAQSPLSRPARYADLGEKRPLRAVRGPEQSA